MIRVGITGQMGSGKSHIVNEFRKLDVPCLILDNAVKTLYVSNQKLIEKIEQVFPDIFVDGKIDTYLIRNKLFNDNSFRNLETMNELLKPYVLDILAKFYEENKNRDFVLVESALIFEYKFEHLFDRVILVNANPEHRKEMAMRRDHITSEEYDSRMKRQISDQEKIKRSDFIITNQFNEKIKIDVLNVYNQLKYENIKNSLRNVKYY